MGLRTKAFLKKQPIGPIDVLVTDAHTRAALAVSRSLARRGVSFLLVGEEPESLGFYSRSVKCASLAPSLSEEPEEFLRFAQDVIRRHGIRLVIPVTDQALLFFDRYRQCFEPGVCLAMAKSAAVRNVLDKPLNLELARQLGIPCPKQFELQSPQQIPEMIEALGFPIVLKRPGDPADPSVPAFDFRVLYAHNERELRGYLDRHCRSGAYPLFQELAQGEVHNLCCFAAQGKLVAIHQYQSLRRFEGVGVVRKIVQPDQELMEHSRRLLGALDWDGIAHVGFFVSRDRKKKWYMETNGRFWGSVQGSIHAGWDFPVWVYEYFLHGKKPEPGPIRIGSLTRWHRGDLSELLKCLAGREAPATRTRGGKARAILQYLSGFSPAMHSEVFRWSDPMPVLVEHKQFFGGILRRLTRGQRLGLRTAAPPR